VKLNVGRRVDVDGATVGGHVRVKCTPEQPDRSHLGDVQCSGDARLIHGVVGERTVVEFDVETWRRLAEKPREHGQSGAAAAQPPIAVETDVFERDFGSVGRGVDADGDRAGVRRLVVGDVAMSHRDAVVTCTHIAKPSHQPPHARFPLRTGYTQDRPARSVSSRYSQDNGNH